ncbi:MAG: hypothetical protein JWQ79_3232 [Mucilaginibacter sp.]|nr:hypothetical protein [Mucilaginibacter sp.]
MNILDNPAWSALISGNNHLSNGNEQAKYFDKEVSPFVALRENSADSFQSLYELVPHQEPVIFISTQEIDIPGKWSVLQCVKGLQMVYGNTIIPTKQEGELVPLTKDHVPQMLDLTKLTNPGPFASRTIEFGHYRGVFDGDKLVAMAGQRLHVFNYAEISAVCTHPDYLGRGYARKLLTYHINRIIAESNIPFLHVRHDNERAIKVYESLGFLKRTEVYFYILKKAGL